MKAAKENEAVTAEQWARESIRIARVTRELLILGDKGKTWGPQVFLGGIGRVVCWCSVFGEIDDLSNLCTKYVSILLSFHLTKLENLPIGRA